MALINCRECSREISSEAYTCPHCGVTVKEKRGFVGTAFKWIAITFLVLIGYAWLVKGGSGTSDSASSPTSSYATEPEIPPLEVQSWRCDTEHGYMSVLGEVKNVSARKLDNVLAVGTFRTAGGELIKSEDALLEFNPILPGQTSPFRASGTENPSFNKCGLAFRYLGGGQIDHTTKEPAAPAKPPPQRGR